MGGQVERSVCHEEWASWRVKRSVRKLTRCGLVENQQPVSRGVARNASCNLLRLLRMADLLSLTSCMIRHRHMSNHSYVIERTMQSSPLLREGGLRNDAAGAALWRTRPYGCAIDVCQLLTTVIAGVCWELSFHLYWFATNGGFARFDNVVNRMETFERETTYE